MRLLHITVFWTPQNEKGILTQKAVKGGGNATVFPKYPGKRHKIVCAGSTQFMSHNRFTFIFLLRSMSNRCSPENLPKVHNVIFHYFLKI